MTHARSIFFLFNPQLIQLHFENYSTKDVPWVILEKRLLFKKSFQLKFFEEMLWWEIRKAAFLRYAAIPHKSIKSKLSKHRLYTAPGLTGAGNGWIDLDGLGK